MARPDVTRVAVSNSVDFSNSSQDIYTPTKIWDVCSSNGLPSISECMRGQKNVYVKFYSASGYSSDVIIGTINLNSVENQTIQTESSSTIPTSHFLNISNINVYNKLKGNILLKVQDAGKAYYVDPVNMKMYYLGRPSDAFTVMRQQGVGITNSNLKKIPIGISTTSGLDQDNDGLSDILEDALGTDKTKSDSDADGYADKVRLAAAEQGYGPMLYDLALSHCKVLTSDRITVSKYAEKVWHYYYTSRRDVEALPFDDIEDPKTPPTLDDAIMQDDERERK
jgi:hypothetical protein